MGRTFENKTVWHSALRDASPLTVRFRKKIQESKFDKPRYEGGLYIPFQVAGDPTPYTLNVENADVEATLAGAELKTWYVLTAAGKADSATIILETPDSGEAPADDDEPDAVLPVARDALFAAGELAEAFLARFGRYPAPADVSFASTLMIRSENLGVPILPPDGERVVPEPSEQEAGDELLDQVRQLAETADLTDTEKEGLEEWLTNGATRQAALQMIVKLKGRQRPSLFA